MIPTLAVLAFVVTGIQAQGIHESINAAGCNATGSDGMVRYSAGQASSEFISGNNCSIAPNVQQACIIEPSSLGEISICADDSKIRKYEQIDLFEIDILNPKFFTRFNVGTKY